jgi:acyl dehydratase
MSSTTSSTGDAPDLVRTASIEITPELIETIISTGGYTHPLFNPTAAQLAAGTTAPLPGQGVLLLMGGLLEQSGALDRAIAMVELKNVRFLQMVTAGSSLSVELEPAESRVTSAGKIIQEYRWTVLDGHDEPVAEARAVMLMHPSADEEPDGPGS